MTNLEVKCLHLIVVSYEPGLVSGTDYFYCILLILFHFLIVAELHFLGYFGDSRNF